ncbi:Hsp20/alpha crystallin family protein [Treponema brennaborense]|uniref:Heat shock protein Hsp20 n=1 Tax=Treponema brennaborense (strain DSM 12168 / CIP 105900 / DD5/3) TaxID=906968 RepID=F4LLM6_TREBD|nr:Hsp20/alpha crystallin family protein [Treponema brennaborense]AEE17670.1 heat shock protein Hsp20 [Treponema brennaborense DSM 12168]
MNSLAFFNPRFTSDLFDVIDRNLADFVPAAETGRAFMNPKVDVRETKDAYVLDMDLPGITEKDVEINLKDRVLSISSVKEEKKEEKKEGEWLIKERRSAAFSRRFTLPQDIDAEKVTAEFKNGVLTIDIPRKPETQAKTIAITAK